MMPLTKDVQLEKQNGTADSYYYNKILRRRLKFYTPLGHSSNQMLQLAVKLLN